MAGFGVDRGSGSSSGNPDSTISAALIDAKGDLIVGSADDTPTRLAVGVTDGLVLQVDSGEATGVKWGGLEPATDFVPLTTELYDLGTTSKKWVDLHLSGDANVGGDLVVDKAVSLRGDISPTQISGNQNDYAPASFADSSALRLSSDASRNVTGLAGGTDGRLLTVHNVGTFPIVFTYEDGSSTAANRFAFGCTLGGGQSMLIQYDSTTSRWRAVHIPEPIGTVKPFAMSTLPAGFLACDGSAVSRTTYASLFNIIGTTWGTGDGSSTFNVPDMRGRTVVGSGTGTLAESCDAANVDTGDDHFDVASNADKWVTGMAVVLTTTDTLPTGLSLATTYYIVRGSATTIKFATTLANAQNGTVIDITGAGAGVHTVTHTLTARTLGGQGGEEAHAMSSTELLLHNGHDSGGQTTGYTLGGSDPRNSGTSNRGGNAAMNNMQPYSVFTMAIRYQ